MKKLFKSKKFIFIIFFSILLLIFSYALIIKAGPILPILPPPPPPPPPAPASPDNPENPPPGTNIGVCVNPPNPDISNPPQPIFSWTTSGNPQTQYWLLVDDSPPVHIPAVGRVGLPSPVIDTGAVVSANKFHQLSRNQLAHNQTYWWCVAVRGANDWTGLATSWTGWTGCQSFYLESRQPVAIDLSVAFMDHCIVDNAATLSWTFSDPDYDRQGAYQVQVFREGTLIRDSERIESSSQSYIIHSGILEYVSNYSWRVRVWDEWNTVSDWAIGPSLSTPSHFYPEPNFTWSPQIPRIGGIVQFTDETEFYDNNPDYRKWKWDFNNDGIVDSTEQHPARLLPNLPTTVVLDVIDGSNYGPCSVSNVLGNGTPQPRWREIIPR